MKFHQKHNGKWQWCLMNVHKMNRTGLPGHDAAPRIPLAVICHVVMEGGRGFTTFCYFALLCLFLRAPATDYSYSESPLTCVTSSISVNLHILSKWQCSDELLILPSGPRGGHLVLEGQLRRIKYFSTRIRYHTNGISTFNPSAFKIIRSGDVETNPGDETVNISSSDARSSPKNLLMFTTQC